MNLGWKRAIAGTVALLISLVLCTVAGAENIDGVPNYTWGVSVDSTDNTGYGTSIASSRNGNNITYTCNWWKPSGTPDVSKVEYNWQYYRNGSWHGIGANSQSITWASNTTTYNDTIRCVVSIGVPGGMDIIDDAYLAFFGRHVDAAGYGGWGTWLMTHNIIDDSQHRAPVITCVSEAEALIRDLVFSDEYMKNRTVWRSDYNSWAFNTDYSRDLVIQCYQYLLRYSPSEGEINYWLDYMSQPAQSGYFDQYYSMGHMVVWKSLPALIHELSNTAAVINAGSAFRTRYAYANYDGTYFHFGSVISGIYQPYTVIHTVYSNQINEPDPVYNVHLQQAVLYANSTWQSGTTAKDYTLTLGDYFKISNHVGEFPARTGYQYGGAGTDDWWYTNPYAYHGGSTDFTIWGSDVVAQLHYYPITFYIQYDSNGGENVGTQRQAFRYDVGGSFSVTQPTRTGYTFRCWRENSTGNEFPNNYNSVGNWRSGDGETVYLTAQWTPNNYTLTANPNGGLLNGGNFGADNGTGNAHSVPTTYGSANYYILGTAVQAGYAFKGWYTDPTGGEKVYDSDGHAVAGTYWNSDNRWIYTGDLTVYAHWERNTYQVVYDANGGENAPAPQTKYARQPLALSTEVPTRDGYKFVSWSTTPDGTGATYALGDSYTTDEDVTLYAQWKVRNVMTAEIWNLTVESSRRDSNRFTKTEYGNIIISLRGEITKVEITYPDALVSCAEPEDLLAPVTLTVGSGIADDGASGKAEFFIPVNFNDELTATVTITATYADGEVITQTPTLIVEPIPDKTSLFHTRLL